MVRRRMYDCIIQCSPLLPSGVTLAEVLEGSSAQDVKDIVASLPDSGTISAAAMITAGQHCCAAEKLDLMCRFPVHLSISIQCLLGAQLCSSTGLSAQVSQT